MYLHYKGLKYFQYLQNRAPYTIFQDIHYLMFGMPQIEMMPNRCFLNATLTHVFELMNRLSTISEYSLVVVLGPNTIRCTKIVSHIKTPFFFSQSLTLLQIIIMGFMLNYR